MAAVDVDNDHDLDLVVTALLGRDVVAVWLNDGAGHLTSQPPAQRPSVDGSASGSSWHGRDVHVDDPLQNDLPSTPLPGFYTHAPPPLVRAARCYPAITCRHCGAEVDPGDLTVRVLVPGWTRQGPSDASA